MLNVTNIQLKGKIKMRSTIRREDGRKSFCMGFHKVMHSELSVFIIVHKHENNLTH